MSCIFHFIFSYKVKKIEEAKEKKANIVAVKAEDEVDDLYESIKKSIDKQFLSYGELSKIEIPKSSLVKLRSLLKKTEYFDFFDKKGTLCEAAEWFVHEYKEDKKRVMNMISDFINDNAKKMEKTIAEEKLAKKNGLCCVNKEGASKKKTVQKKRERESEGDELDQKQVKKEATIVTKINTVN